MMTNKPLNVILIGIDTLRYDHLGFSGYHRDTSPNIDTLAKESLVFHNCYSQAPTTGPSFASMFTSRYPTFHGLTTVWTKKRGWSLADGIPTLQGILQNNGYTTAAFTEGGTLSPHVGLSKGFDVYETKPESLIDADTHPAIAWMEKNSKNPFFLFFHTFATHAPYIAPPEYRSIYKDKDAENYSGPLPSTIEELSQNRSINRITFKQLAAEVKNIPEEIERLKTMYDECIHYMDTFVGKLLEKIHTLGLDKNTVIVFTSDHGEGFMEHGNIGHESIHDEILHVPLIVKIPLMSERKNVNQIVRSIDIMPTILALLNIQTNETLQGVSLLPILEGMDLNLVSLAEFDYRGFSLRNKFYKYIFSRKTKTELYNIVSDPRETKNLSEYSLPLVEKLHNEFQRELTHKKLVRPPHNMFILVHRTVEKMMVSSDFTN